MKENSKTGYVLHLHALPNYPGDPEQRLKLALKALLRGYGLRAVELKPSSPQDKPQAPEAAEGAGKDCDAL